MDVFGANRFRPVGAAAPISHGRGPRRREGALIVDRELELQVLAGVVWRGLSAPILLYIPIPSVSRGFIIDEPITFHYVQRRTVRCTVYIKHGKWPDLDADGVNHQRVVFPMADGVPYQEGVTSAGWG